MFLTLLKLLHNLPFKGKEENNSIKKLIMKYGCQFHKIVEPSSLILR